MALSAQEHIAGYEALLTVAEQLLDVGLSDILSAALQRRRSAESVFDESDFLVRLVVAALAHQIHEVLQVLLRIAAEHLSQRSGSDGEPVSSASRAAQDWLFSLLREPLPLVALDHSHCAFSPLSSQRFGEGATAAALHCAAVVADPLHEAQSESESEGERETDTDARRVASFRRLRASQGIGRGLTVLRETPYAFCLSANSGLFGSERSEKEALLSAPSSLLREHIYLAVSLFRERERNPHKFERMRRQLCTGLPSYLQRERLRDTFAQTQLCYDPRTVQRMSVFCALFVLLRFIYAESSFESFACASFVQRAAQLSAERDSLAAEARLLLDVLSALPINTHAVTHLVDSSPLSHSSQALLRTQRVGVALFLSASAVNHSCAPNAALRFEGVKDCVSSLDTLSPSSPSLSVRDTARACLESQQLSVFALRNAARGEELCISYGVLAGRDSLSERERVLRDQYLFLCRCVACEDESARRSESEAREKSLLKEEVRARVRDVSAQRVRDFCRGLNEQRREIERLNLALMEKLRVNKQSVSSTALESFEREEVALCVAEMERLAHSLPTVASEWAAILAFHEQSRESREAKANNVLSPSLSEVDRDIMREFVALQCSLLDLLAQLQSAQGRFLAAAENVLLATNAFLAAQLYPESDVAIARERVKLAGLYFNAGEMSLCQHWASLATDCLQIVVTEDDPDRVEAEQMLTFTNRLLKQKTKR